jgi:hypothetical protein
VIGKNKLNVRMCEYADVGDEAAENEMGEA